jgi:hypothetical protein
MNGKPGLPFPLSLVVVDGLGALLFALGAAGHFGNLGLLSSLLPQVPKVNLLAMLLGGALMAFAMIGIVRATLRRAREQQTGSASPQTGVPGAQPGLARPQRDRERR